jgi:PEP-CTERM motif
MTLKEVIMKGLLAGVVMGLLSLGMVQVASADLINGSFEDLTVPNSPNWVHFLDASQSPSGGHLVIPGWHTTASDHLIEVWSDGFHDNAPASLLPYSGNQFAELNATEPSTLYQDISGIAVGSTVGYQFAHRGRLGVDVMQFTITDLGADGAVGGTGSNADTNLLSQQYSDNNDAWGFYQGSGITTLGNTMRFSYVSVSANGGAETNLSQGNFLDAAAFGVGVGVVPEPSTYALLCISLGVVGFARKKMGKKEA